MKAHASTAHRPLLHAALVVLALGASACGAPFEGPARLVLGTGFFSFGLLAEDQTVPIIHGPQGGYHVWAAVQARSLEFSQVMVTFSATYAADGRAIETTPNQVSLAPIDDEHAAAAEGSGWGEALRLFVLLPDPAAVTGQRVRIHAAISDGGGREATDEQVVVPML